MIKSITVTNYVGDSIELELTRPDKSGFIIKSVTGLGPTKASVKMSKNAASDGEVYNSSTLDKRNIVFEFEFMDSRTETIEDARLKSYKYFPINTNVELLIKTDKREVTTVGLVESNEPNIFSRNEGCTISILCPDPYLYSLESNETTFSGVSPEFEFPFDNNSLSLDLIEMGSIEYKTENIVYYDGEAPVGVTIVIHTIGEVGDITMYNVTTKESMKLDTNKINTLVIPESYSGILNEYYDFIPDDPTDKDSDYEIYDKRAGVSIGRLEYSAMDTVVYVENGPIVRLNGKFYKLVSFRYGDTFSSVRWRTPDLSGMTVWDEIECLCLFPGDTIISTTGRGNKTITLLRDGVSTNIFNALGRDTSWFTLSRGDNRFVYDAETGSENVQFHISNKIVYLGV